MISQGIGSSTHPPKHQTRRFFCWQKSVALPRLNQKKTVNFFTRPCFDVVPWVSTMKSGSHEKEHLYPPWNQHDPWKKGAWETTLLLKMAYFQGLHDSFRRVSFQVFGFEKLRVSRSDIKVEKHKDQSLQGGQWSLPMGKTILYKLYVHTKYIHAIYSSTCRTHAVFFFKCWTSKDQTQDFTYIHSHSPETQEFGLVLGTSCAWSNENNFIFHKLSGFCSYSAV